MRKPAILILLFLLNFFFSMSSYSASSSDVEMGVSSSSGKKPLSNEDVIVGAPDQKRQKRLPLDVFDVVDYFLMKDKLRREGGVKGRNIDPLKLQKLCYYAQAYFLAINGRPLFNANITENYHGPFIRGVHNLYRGYSIDFQKEVKLETYDPQIAQHLDTIYNMNLLLTGKQLEFKTHQEDPWKTTPRYGIITDEKMATYFSQEKKLEEYARDMYSDSLEDSECYISQFVNKNIPLEKIINIIRLKDIPVYIEYLINKNTLFEEIINVIRQRVDKAKNGNDLIAIKEMLENIPKEAWKKVEAANQTNPVLSRIRWPHQTVEHSMLGSGFFPPECEKVLGLAFLPKELEDLYDTPVSLYGREKIRYRLAISARYKNPLALYHLSRLLEVYSERDTSQLKIKSEVFLQEARKYFGETSTNEEAHPFLRGLSYLHLEDKDNAKRQFQEAFNSAQEDTESLYYLSILNEGSSSNFYDQAIEKNCFKALLNKGDESETDEETFYLYLQAGEKGVAEGYYRVAKMLNRKFSPPQEFDGSEDPLFYLEEAGKLGMLTAYDFAADISIKKGDLEGAKHFYEQKGDGGSPKGYYDLARIYQNGKNKEKAIEFYRKAGPLMGVLEVAELEGKINSLEDKKKIEVEFNKLYHDHFDELIKIATAEEDKIDGDAQIEIME